MEWEHGDRSCPRKSRASRPKNNSGSVDARRCVSGYAYFHDRVYTPHPSPVNGGILYERSVNQIPVGMSKLTVRLDKAGNLIAHWLLIRVHTASLYIALRLN